MSIETHRTMPNLAHLVWLGSRFPWLNVLAVRSAAERGGFDRVVLHHDSDLSATPFFDELAKIPRVELRLLDWDRVFERCGRYDDQLAAVLPRLRTPGVRSDLLRTALLYAQGGVYLDMDTVTVKTLAPLIARAEAFVGRERLCYTAGVKGSYNVPRHSAAAVRSMTRAFCRRIPEGWRTFRKIERFFPTAVNGAIMGSAPQGRFITGLVEGLLEVPARKQHIVCAIGPDLIQGVAPGFDFPFLEVHSTDVFYPLGPEISEHWFRNLARGTAKAAFEEVISPETRVIHWYASVRTKQHVPVMDPDFIRAHADRQMLSAAALDFVEQH